MKKKILIILSSIFMFLNLKLQAVTLNYYQVLGVSQTATDREIINAFRKLSLKYHPDKNAGNKEVEEKYKEITVAYTVLSNPDTRKEYNEFLNKQKELPNKPTVPTKEDEELTSAHIKEALKELLSMGQIALTIPSKLNIIKESTSKLVELSTCLQNPQSSSCDENLCKKNRTICAGVAIGEFAKILEPSVHVILGQVRNKEVEKNGKMTKVLEYNRGLISSVLYILPNFIQKFLKALPSNIKNESNMKQAISYIDTLMGTVNTTVVPKMANITEYLQMTNEMLNALSFALAPEEVLKTAPSVEIPPLEIEASEGEQDEFSFEDIEEE